MCMTSFVGDQLGQSWPQQYPWVYTPDTRPTREDFDKLRADVEAMKKLLAAAKQYDKDTGQPDCEMEEKLALLRRFAEFVGVDLEDVLTNNERGK